MPIRMYRPIPWCYRIHPPVLLRLVHGLTYSKPQPHDYRERTRIMSNLTQLPLRTEASPGKMLPPGYPDLLAKLVDAATTASDSDRAKAQRPLEQALTLLAGGSSPGRKPSECPPCGGLASWQAKRVAAHVSEHIGTRLMVGELAALVRLSLSHFHRRFKVSFGEPPALYIMRQRMRRAQDLLITTGAPLSHVALECGLYDQAHFSRAFRRSVGISPRVYRRQFASDGVTARTI
jgi:AraC family transcriptional regulator